MGLCDQSGISREAVMSNGRKLLSAAAHPRANMQAANLGDDTFCQFCSMAVSYIKVDK